MQHTMIIGSDPESRYGVHSLKTHTEKGLQIFFLIIIMYSKNWVMFLQFILDLVGEKNGS